MRARQAKSRSRCVLGREERPASTKVLRQELRKMSRERAREEGHRLSCNVKTSDFTLRALTSHLRGVCMCVCDKVHIKFHMLAILSV